MSVRQEAVLFFVFVSHTDNTIYEINKSYFVCFTYLQTSLQLSSII